jgi:long-subunit fatty acid transport protein
MTGAVTAGACLFLATGTAFALTDEAIFRRFQFNFTNPGARALGLGGAFIAAADDATAAQANPAALNYLNAPEFFAEVRHSDLDSEVFTSQFGTLDTSPRDLPFLELTSVNNPEDLTNGTFVSYVQPFRFGEKDRRFVLAFSRQVVLDAETSLTLDSENTRARFAFDSFPNTFNPITNQVEVYSVDTLVEGESDTEIVYWNLGASYEVHPDFSIGATVSFGTLDLQAQTVTTVNDPLQLFVDPTHPRLVTMPDDEVFRTFVDGTDSDVAWTVGVHWHPDSIFPTGRSDLQFGAVFRKGAEFAVEENTFRNDIIDRTFDNVINVPDRYGVGVSYKPGNWTLTADYERINFSDLLEGFESGVNFLTSGDVAGGAFPVDPATEPVYEVDDGDVIHLGAEYTFGLRGGLVPLGVRAGYYNSPDNRIRLSSFNATGSNAGNVNTTFIDAFRGGEEVDHFTAGAGIGFGNSLNSTIQVAGDFSDDGTEVLISYILRFLKFSK